MLLSEMYLIVTSYTQSKFLSSSKAEWKAMYFLPPILFNGKGKIKA